VFDDQLSAVANDSRRWGTTGEVPDLALLVDGLQAEREQGITIDVAYRYFSTPTRKFIVADCPGHEQYTRNMATGASPPKRPWCWWTPRRACACRRAVTRTSLRCWACRT
jgi:sulfate adenylyltransferase subunit 1 (EFTu-like GTPase family)